MHVPAVLLGHRSEASMRSPFRVLSFLLSFVVVTRTTSAQPLSPPVIQNATTVSAEARPVRGPSPRPAIEDSGAPFRTAIGLHARLANRPDRWSHPPIAFHALVSTTHGDDNTASGFAALTSNTTGEFNTATGVYSLAFNATGRFNTANGWQAGYHNTTGTNNVKT